MPNVLTPLVASSVHVVKALEEMDSLVQVNNLWMDRLAAMREFMGQ